MADFSTLRRDLHALINNLVATQPVRSLRVANDLIAQTNLRRNERGQDADGGSYSPYSRSWAKDRRERGRQVARKDFNDTGALNRSIHAEVNKASFGYVEIGISPRGRDNELKVLGAFGHEKREGASDRAANILAPSERELMDAGASAFDLINVEISRYL